MKPNETKEKFNKYSEEEITDKISAEIEDNLKSFFELLLEWQNR